MPQVLIGLFVDFEGYPFDFDCFTGNYLEGHTFKTSVEKLIKKYQFGVLPLQLTPVCYQKTTFCI